MFQIYKMKSVFLIKINVKVFYIFMFQILYNMKSVFLINIHVKVFYIQI